MIAILCSTWIASLIGSGHCVGMCGPFAMIASHSANPDDASVGNKSGSSVRLTLFYNLGRFITYLVFGLIAGFLGLAINFSGQQFGLQQAAIYFAGGTLILFGVVGIFRNLGWKWFQWGVNPKLVSWLQSGIKSANRSMPSVRALLIGMLTTLMPCGWLYFFVIAASSTQSLLWAPVVMTVFWLGNLPILASLGISSNFLVRLMRSKAKWVIPILMLTIGIYSISSRRPIELANQLSTLKPETPAEVISTANSTPLPCCSDDNP